MGLSMWKGMFVFGWRTQCFPPSTRENFVLHGIIYSDFLCFLAFWKEIKTWTWSDLMSDKRNLLVQEGRVWLQCTILHRWNVGTAGCVVPERCFQGGSLSPCFIYCSCPVACKPRRELQIKGTYVILTIFRSHILKTGKINFNDIFYFTYVQNAMILVCSKYTN